MKLAFFLFKYFPFGGLQRDFLRIARICIQRGYQIDVYTMQWEGEHEPGLNVQLIPVKGFQNHTRQQAFVSQLQPYLTAARYDLIVGFNKMPGLDVYYAADTCYQEKARTQHSYWYRLLPRYRHYLAYEQAVFASYAHTEILLLSPLQQVEFIKYYQTPQQRFHLLPPGIEKNRLAPPNAVAIRAELRNEYRIAETDFLLLMIGSGFKTKGLDRTLLAMHALSPDLRKRCRLLVIGKDNPKPFLRIANQLNIINQVQFLGGREDVPRFLLAADILLHPAYNENTGTVLLEAIASGLPVLTVDICGYAHYIRQANAGIVMTSPFQQTIFNTTLTEMLLSPLRAEWRANGIRFATTNDMYSLPEHAANIIEQKLSVTLHQTGKEKDMTWLHPTLASYFSHNNYFQQAMFLCGEVFRELDGRRTQRITIDNKHYFIKQHFGVGWKEIIKNLSQLRLPILSARNEWLAIQYLRTLEIPVPQPMGYGYRGTNPARLQSFLITKELENVLSLESYCKNWQITPPAFKLKQALIKEVARITRVMHDGGINHRDLYICHYLVDLNTLCTLAPRIYLIDLHRAQIRQQVPSRWLIKDLAGLDFSSKDIGLTTRDLLRFIKEYRKLPLRDILTNEANFWQKVKARGNKTYQAHH